MEWLYAKHDNQLLRMINMYVASKTNALTFISQTFAPSSNIALEF